MPPYQKVADSLSYQIMDHRLRVATARDIPAMMAVLNAAFAIETFMEGTRTDEAHLSEVMRQETFLLACDSSGGGSGICVRRVAERSRKASAESWCKQRKITAVSTAPAASILRCKPSVRTARLPHPSWVCASGNRGISSFASIESGRGVPLHRHVKTSVRGSASR